MNTMTDEIRVMTSGAFIAAYLELIPRLELLTKKKLVTVTTSIGTGENSIPNRLQRGEAQIGFQQISELLPVPGIEHITPLPPEVQKVSVFSAGVAATTRDSDSAHSVIRFLASPEAAHVITKSGLEPTANR